uniref:Response regulatory domain-containing protein n=1 Tax=Eiseniibacteriota bacterium TaxID=2212470 RepID=A0A832I558_UNCEI
MSTGVVLCACGASGHELLERPLAQMGVRLARTKDDTLLEDVLALQPDVVVYELRESATPELGILHLMRRIAPDVQLVLVAGDESLDTQRLVRELRPVYYAVQPVDGEEIVAAVRAALALHARKAAH